MNTKSIPRRLSVLLITSLILIVLIASILILTQTLCAATSDSKDRAEYEMHYIDEEITAIYPSIKGITTRTELEHYPEGTQRILVIWDNQSEYDALYGKSFLLEQYNELSGEWTIVKDPEAKRSGFESVGIRLGKSIESKYTYYINCYAYEIKEGRYRIRANYSIHIYAQTEQDEYTSSRGTATAEFTITKDTSLHKPSELDYAYIDRSEELIFPRNMTSYIVRREIIPVHIYKNLALQNTDLVIDGGEIIELASGKDGQIIDYINHHISESGNQLLLYALYTKAEKWSSQYIIYDVKNKKEILRSEAYENCAMLINERFHIEDGIYEIMLREYKELTAEIIERTSTGQTGTMPINNISYHINLEHADYTLTQAEHES